VGSGVSKNPDVAALPLQEAAKKGSGSAACYLGYMIYSGFGIKQDRAQAERWYRIGVRLHDPLSAFAIGALLSVNDGHPHDIPQAVDL
jgi:TPR repeat protein